MTQPPASEPVPVEQVDRGFVASYLRARGMVSLKEQQAIIDGKWDETPHVQEVARHRLAASTPITSDARSKLIEALKRTDDGEFPSLDDRADAILAALRDRPTEGGVVERLRAAVEPVLHWYQSDEHADRPLEDIVADIVADLQHDRPLALASLQAGEAAPVVERATIVEECAMVADRHVTRCLQKVDGRGVDDARAIREDIRALSATPAKPDQTAQGEERPGWDVDWRDFTGGENGELIGRGCGEHTTPESTPETPHAE